MGDFYAAVCFATITLIATFGFGVVSGFLISEEIHKKQNKN